MVGLSVVLEGHKDITKKTHHYHHQVINKASMIKSAPSSSSSPTTPSSPSPFTITKNPFNLSSYSTSSSGSGGLAKSGFLDRCFLCRQKLLPGKDIYMYKGDRAFCSEECRCRQIFMDEEELMIKAKTDHCSLAASSSTSTRKGAKNQANGFAY